MTDYNPIMAITKLIKENVTDPNTSRNNLPVFPDWPRTDLTKTSYPRISITRVSASANPVSIGSYTYLEETTVLQIDVWIWAKERDEQILTISSVTYSEEKLRDYFTHNVISELRNHFYSDTNTSGYYDFRVRNIIDVPFDENIGIMRGTIEIEITRMETS